MSNQRSAGTQFSIYHLIEATGLVAVVLFCFVIPLKDWELGIALDVLAIGVIASTFAGTFIGTFLPWLSAIWRDDLPEDRRKYPWTYRIGYAKFYSGYLMVVGCLVLACFAQLLTGNWIFVALWMAGAHLLVWFISSFVDFIDVWCRFGLKPLHLIYFVFSLGLPIACVIALISTTPVGDILPEPFSMLVGYIYASVCLTIYLIAKSLFGYRQLEVAIRHETTLRFHQNSMILCFASIILMGISQITGL